MSDRPSVWMLKRYHTVKRKKVYVWRARGGGITAHGYSHREAAERWRRKWESHIAERVAAKMTDLSPEEEFIEVK